MKRYLIIFGPDEYDPWVEEFDDLEVAKKYLSERRSSFDMYLVEVLENKKGNIPWNRSF